MRETNHAVRLEPHLIPTTAKAVRMYEERGGRLNTDPSTVMIQLRAMITFKSQGSTFFFQSSPFASIFRDVVHDRIDTFVTAIKIFIEITEFLAQTEATL